MTEESIAVTLQTKERNIAMIDGERYEVLDYVEPWFERHKLGPGSIVDIKWRLGSTESTRHIRYLCMIGLHKKGTTISGKKIAEKELVGVYRRIAGGNAVIFVNGKDSHYCLTKAKAAELEEATAGQEIQFVVDQNNFILRYDLGPVQENPPAESPPGFVPASKIEKEPQPEPTAQPEPEPVKEPEKTEAGTCTSPPSKTILRLGGTISLEGYENIKCELEGEVNSPADREDLIRFWDETLALLGRNNAMVRDKVDSYRKRVIMGAIADAA